MRCYGTILFINTKESPQQSRDKAVFHGGVARQCETPVMRGTFREIPSAAEVYVVRICCATIVTCRDVAAGRAAWHPARMLRRRTRLSMYRLLHSHRDMRYAEVRVRAARCALTARGADAALMRHATLMARQGERRQRTVRVAMSGAIFATAKSRETRRAALPSARRMSPRANKMRVVCGARYVPSRSCCRSTAPSSVFPAFTVMPSTHAHSHERKICCYAQRWRPRCLSQAICARQASCSHYARA